MVSVGRMKNGGRGFGSAPFFCCVHMWCVSKKRDTRYGFGACMVGVGRAGTKPRLRRHCPVLAALRSGLKKGVRPCLAASRLRLNPDSAPAGASRGAARSGGARLPRPGRPLRSGCSPLRLRGCCASLRPRSPLAPRLALRLLPGRSVGRRSARALVGRRCRCRPSRPCCGSGLRPPVSRPPARPGLPAALCPASRSRRGAARLSGCRPRWPRCVAFRPPAWVCSVAGAVVRLRARGWVFRWLRPAGTPRPPWAGGQGHIFPPFSI